MVATLSKLGITEYNVDKENLIKTFKRSVTWDPWRRGGGATAPSSVTGSLRRIQEKNESTNCTVLSRRKICAHC